MCAEQDSLRSEAQLGPAARDVPASYAACDSFKLMVCVSVLLADAVAVSGVVADMRAADNAAWRLRTLLAASDAALCSSRGATEPSSRSGDVTPGHEYSAPT